MRQSAVKAIAALLGAAGAAAAAGRAAGAAMTGALAGGVRGPDGRYDNPWPTWTGDKKFSEATAFGLQMRRLDVPNWGYLEGNRRPTLADMAAAFPVHAPDYTALASPDPGAVSATWAGHAAALVQLEGLTLLTDPVFAERASPVQFLGPRRAVPAAISVDDPRLPRVDAVLISHNHYDHLCDATVRQLHRRFGDGLSWYVPLGLARWFAKRGITNVTELGWWEERQHPGSKVRMVLTPAQHWSARTPFDRRETLWGGWAVVGERARFWFAGDTGYAPVFEEIGRRLGPFDLAAIPIGAYEPRGFMTPQHVNPQEAVRIHKEVRARRSFAIHCCTFHLTLEPLDEPPRLLALEAAAAGLEADEFVCLQHGASLVVKDGRVANGPLLRLPLAPQGAAAAPTDAAPGPSSGGGGGGEAAAAAQRREEL